MDERSSAGRWRRRTYLAAATALATTLAGCGGREDATATDETATTTVERATTTARTTTEAPDSTETTTEAVDDVVEFDGGGASAFAAALDELRALDGGTLRIAPGTHRLDASEAPAFEYPLDDFRVHFDARGVGDVTITGPGPDAGTATVVLADPTRGFLLFEDDEPTVRDLEVRHDPWPHAQGTIVALADDHRQVTLALDDQSPTFDEPPFDGDVTPDVVAASVFTADGERVRGVTGPDRGNFKRVADATRVGPRRYRLTLADGVETGGLAVDRRLAVKARYVGANAVACVDCTQPTVERVALRSAAGFCQWFVACDRPVVVDSEVARAPDSDRLVSVNADGVHCDNGPRGPRVERCRFERCGDDAVVADDELLVVDAFEDDRRVRVRGTFGSRVGAGDRLVAATPTFDAFTTLPPVAAVDERGGPVTTDVANPELVVFDRAVDDALSTGDVLTSPRMRNRDTVVRDTVVRDIRARYVRIGGADGVTIEGNDLGGTHSDGIEVEAVGNTTGAAGFPKAWSTDVVVRNNTLSATGLVGVPSGVPTGIFVGVDAGETTAADSPARSGRPHRNVVVDGNEVTATAGPGIVVADAETVTVTENQVRNPGRIPAPALAAYGLGCWNVADATVADTTVTADADDLDGFGWRRGVSGLSTNGNRYVVAGTDRDPTIEHLDD